MSQIEKCSDHRNKIVSNIILFSIIIAIILGSHFLIPSVIQNLIQNNIYTECSNDGFASSESTSYSQSVNVYTLTSQEDEIFLQIPIENITTFDLFVYLYIDIDFYNDDDVELKFYRASDTFNINDKNSFIKTPFEDSVSVLDPYFELNVNSITSEDWTIEGFLYIIITLNGDYEDVQVRVNSIRRVISDDHVKTSVTSKTFKSIPSPDQVKTILYAVYIIGGLISIIFLYGIISASVSFRGDLCHENKIEEKHRF